MSFNLIKIKSVCLLCGCELIVCFSLGKQVLVYSWEYSDVDDWHHMEEVIEVKGEIQCIRQTK